MDSEEKLLAIAIVAVCVFVVMLITGTFISEERYRRLDAEMAVKGYCRVAKANTYVPCMAEAK